MKTNVIVIKEVVNQLMDLVDEIEGAGNRVLRTKWSNKSIPTYQTIPRIPSGANDTQINIHGPYKNQWQKKIHSQPTTSESV